MPFKHLHIFFLSLNISSSWIILQSSRVTQALKSCQLRVVRRLTSILHHWEKSTMKTWLIIHVAFTNIPNVTPKHSRTQTFPISSEQKTKSTRQTFSTFRNDTSPSNLLQVLRNLLDTARSYSRQPLIPFRTHSCYYRVCLLSDREKMEVHNQKSSPERER